MKKILIILTLVLTLVNSKSIVLLDEKGNSSKLLIQGSGEECRVIMKSSGQVTKTNCVKITNSKGVKILCTKRKKMCKTQNEIREFIGGSSNSYQYCLDNAMNNYEMKECNGRELTHQDTLLNKNYKKAMRTLSLEEKKKLKKAQRAWIKYRDSKCDAAGEPMRGGTGETLLVVGCLIGETKRRAEELNSIVSMYN